MTLYSRITRIVRQIICFAVCFVVIGCRQKDLYFPEDFDKIVEVEFVWSHADNASVEGMSTYFFPLNPEGKIWNFELAGNKGGLISLPCGDYTLVTVNNDLPGIDLIDGFSASSITVNARYVNNARYNGDILRPSGMVYGAVIENVRITGKGIQYLSENHTTEKSDHTIRVFPDSLSTVYNLRLTELYHSEEIVNAYGILSGVAVSLLLDGATPGRDTAAVVIPLNISDEIMTGSTTGLGTPSVSPNFILSICVEFIDGRKSSKTFDVTKQILEARFPHNVWISLNGIDFDDSDSSSTDDQVDMGLDVDVEGWSNVDIDLITRD